MMIDYDRDVVCMFNDFVTSVTYEGVELNAMINMDAEKPPPYGYENTLSARWHEFNFIRNQVQNPKRGDKILMDGKVYRVDYVKPGEDLILSVYATND